MCLSLLDFPPSKTYKRALKFEVFCVFLGKNHEKRKKVMKFLTGLCQNDVTTSSGDVISKKKLHSHVRDKILGKVTEGIFKIGHGSGVMQQKIGLGVNSPPSLVLCVLIASRVLFRPDNGNGFWLGPNNRDRGRGSWIMVQWLSYRGHWTAHPNSQNCKWSIFSSWTSWRAKKALASKLRP